MKKFLSGFNPMLINLILGCLIYFVAAGAVISAALMIYLPEHFLKDFLGFVIGVIIAVVQVIHIYYSLRGTLEQGEERSAVAHSGRMYAVRLLIFLILFAVVFFLLGLESLLFTMLGMASLKVAAYLQPFTDKFVSKIYK